MTYQEKYKELLEEANVTWLAYMHAAHYENDIQPLYDKAYNNWQKASSEFIDFHNQMKKDDVNIYDEYK